MQLNIFVPLRHFDFFALGEYIKYNNTMSFDAATDNPYAFYFRVGVLFSLFSRIV